VTNTGQGDAVYRLKTVRKGARTKHLNDLLFVRAEASKHVVVWAKKAGRRARVGLKAVVL